MVPLSHSVPKWKDSLCITVLHTRYSSTYWKMPLYFGTDSFLAIPGNTRQHVTGNRQQVRGVRVRVRVRVSLSYTTPAILQCVSLYSIASAVHTMVWWLVSMISMPPFVECCSEEGCSEPFTVNSYGRTPLCHASNFEVVVPPHYTAVALKLAVIVLPTSDCSIMNICTYTPYW